MDRHEDRGMEDRHGGRRQEVDVCQQLSGRMSGSADPPDRLMSLMSLLEELLISRLTGTASPW